jgi:hypothetical protein
VHVKEAQANQTEQKCHREIGTGNNVKHGKQSGIRCQLRGKTKNTEHVAALDLLFVFIICICLLSTRKYVGLLNLRRTFKQVAYKFVAYFMLMVQCYTSLLIAKYVPTNVSLVAIDNASIHQHIIQTFISFTRV